VTTRTRARTVQYETKTDAALNEVRSRILSGALGPGTALNQEELAADIGVSTTPLREALRRLAADGLIEISAHRDARVAALSITEARHIFETRVPLDSLAVQLAAERYDSADERRIREAAKRLRPVQDGAAAVALRTNSEFHRAVYEASHNPILIGLLDRLWDQSDRYRSLGAHIFLGKGLDRDSHHTDHLELMRLVLERDGKRASELMRDHVESSLRSIREARLANTDEDRAAVAKRPG
jgi:DNA-binding GntR family transcriptional regulator